LALFDCRACIETVQDLQLLHSVLPIQDVLSRIWDLELDPTIFSSEILHEKWTAYLLLTCFLWFQEQSLGQKDMGCGVRDLGSGKKNHP
jgi:hypothetical protein